MKNDLVHLHVHSTYSLLDSIATIPKLVRCAKELGMTALALTDHGNMFGIKEFYDACERDRGEKAIKPILGCEVYVTSSGDHTKRDKNEKRYHLCLYAKNKVGYLLIVQDYVAAARRMGVAVGPGRGLAAGSAVVYALGITSIDPLAHDLPFELYILWNVFEIASAPLLLRCK